MEEMMEKKENEACDRKGIGQEVVSLKDKDKKKEEKGKRRKE